MTQRSGVSCSAELGSERACAPPSAQALHRDRQQREHAERRKREQQFRRDRGLEIEVEPAIGAAGRETRLVGVELRRQHAVEAGAGKCEGEGRRDDAERGRGHERQQPHAGERRHEIDQEEREHRHQPQEQEIAEGVLAEALREPLSDRTGAPLQQRSPNAVLATRNTSVAPMVAPTIDASPPTTTPNRMPPAIVR